LREGCVFSNETMKQLNNVFLSVVISSYNEEENIRKGALKHIYGFLSKKNFSWEVIINDDGSTDKSKALLKDQISKLTGFRFIEGNHGGKPAGLANGLNVARGKYILFTDMDQSTPIEEIDKLLPHLKKDVGAVIGSRGLERKNFPIYRRIGAIVFRTFRQALILPEISDTQCGFKLFDAEVLKKCFPKIEFFKNTGSVKGWKVTSYDVELLHLIKKARSKIEEVEVGWQNEDISTGKGGSLERYFKESKEMLVQILRVKLNDLRGLYDY
jgi:dolichyl-phosphate beta-glucosyltransferase